MWTLVYFAKIALTDLFQYTYSPVRFNRKTRKVYFFQSNKPGGVVAVPWGDEKVFFHIGKIPGGLNFVILRCHLLDDEGLITHTFTVGHRWGHENAIREEWALIRRYMEEGPEKAFDNEFDRVITLSTWPTWRNCYLMACLAMGRDLIRMVYIRYLLFPIYGLITLCRYLALLTCQEPVFPPEVEAECAIAPNDPYNLPEPEYMAEFADQPGVYERAEQRFQERQWRQDN